MKKFFWRIKRSIRNAIPSPVLGAYHFSIALLGAFICGFPSSKLLVIGITGTKGKSSTTEMINAILEEAGYKTAVLNSIRIKVGDHSEPNTMRMSMPGRFYIQNFLLKALQSDCTAVVLEMTSEGARQYRHRGIALNALIFTNLAPEHIESHGSLEAYANAKFELGKQLARSHKRPRIMVANADDAQSPRYLALPVEYKIPFSLEGAKPYHSDEHGGHFHFDDVDIPVLLPGDFSLKNALAAATLTHTLGVETPTIQSALSKLNKIPGRAERIEAGQDFTVVVDYAHTPDSLEALYDAYKNTRRICVLGSTGGGRDMWKRPVMGSVADQHCDEVILTNEDPYDEDPQSIIDMLARGMKRKPQVIIDRRDAIAHAISMAKTGDSVLITGKGTDPNIAVAQGKKIPWSDARVAHEEIEKHLARYTGSKTAV